MNPAEGVAPGANPTPVIEGELVAPQPVHHVPQPPKRIPSQQITQMMQFSGPMPPPELLERYEQICAGSADRMLAMVEKESAHRREQEAKIVDRQVKNHQGQFTEARIGQFCALGITWSAIAAGVYLVMNGHDAAGDS